ncbi:hypothetical protein PCI56_13710 [Plesiomonas shigelloides subsp. oncorhynchi]|nr:hypothetical protein [Plesiomonas shigelloides]MDA1380577.1 hypothetical protein [Plesiomonas shigelloides]MDA1380625.1 hypothetical protein [Plesiomonas shigelloides]
MTEALFWLVRRTDLSPYQYRILLLNQCQCSCGECWITLARHRAFQSCGDDRMGR